MGRLAGKCAVVVGASLPGNMGQAIARRFRAEGAEVVVASRNAEASARFAADIGAHSAPCDITRREDLYALTRFAREKMGGLDVAVNSTGLALGAPFLEFGESDMERIVAVQ